MQKRFIEYDLPLAEISEQLAHEKNVHIGLPPRFHVWWARRPLVVPTTFTISPTGTYADRHMDTTQAATCLFSC